MPKPLICGLAIVGGKAWALAVRLQMLGRGQGRLFLSVWLALSVPGGLLAVSFVGRFMPSAVNLSPEKVMAFSLAGLGFATSVIVMQVGDWRRELLRLAWLVPVHHEWS